MNQLSIQTGAYGVALFAGIDSVAQSRSKLFFTDSMGSDPEGQDVIQRCGEELSHCIQRKWSETYFRHKKRVQSYRTAANDRTYQLTSQ